MIVIILQDMKTVKIVLLRKLIERLEIQSVRGTNRHVIVGVEVGQVRAAVVI